MKGKKVISRLTKVFYALGIVMLLSGMLLSAITSPALAQEQATTAAGEGEEETASDPTATPVPDDGSGDEDSQDPTEVPQGDEGSQDPTEVPGGEEGSEEPPKLQVEGPVAVEAPSLSSECADDGSVNWYVTGAEGGVTYYLTSDHFSGVIEVKNKNTVLVFTGAANSEYSVSITWTIMDGSESGQLNDEATVDMCEGGGDDPEWSKSSLSFEGSCEGDCEEVTAQVCNVGSGDMSGSVEYQVWYAASGNPKNGTVVGGGSVGPMASGGCEDLTYTPTEDGNYMFQAFQETGHPGGGDLWSDECSVDQCSVSVPEEDFYWSLSSDPDSSSCDYYPVPMCTTFVVEAHNIPEGYSLKLQTNFYEVAPNYGNNQAFYASAVGEGVTEVEVCGQWPGIGDGDHPVEIHFGGKLIMIDNATYHETPLNSDFDSEGVDVFYIISMKEQCDIPEEPELEITETCPDYVNSQDNFTVSNTGTVDADFTWESSNGENGTGSVAVGGTTTITTSRGSTPATVTIFFGTYGEKSATAMTDEEAEAAQCTLPEKPSLIVTGTCPDYDNSLNAWLVTNTGKVAVDFTWSTSEGESGSGSVGIGGTASFTTPRGAAVETVTVTYGDGKTASADSMTDEEAEAAQCTMPEKPSLTVIGTCPDFDNSLNAWLVTNTGSVAADFTWSTSEGESGSGSVGIGGTASFTTPRGATVETVTVTYGDGKTASADSMTDEEAEEAECTMPEKPSLTIIATCPDYDNSLNEWMITNTGSVAVSFTWSSTEGQNGSGSVGIGGTSTFTTPRGDTVETVTVTYGDGKTASADSMTDEEAKEAECEIPQEPVLNLVSTCPDFVEELNNWTIINIGSVTTSYSWTSTTGEGGSGSLNSGESVNFSTDRSSGPDDVTVTYVTDKSITKTAMTDEEAEAEFCEMPPELEWSLEGEGDYAYCEWESLNTCTTFVVTLANLGKNETAFLRTTFEEVLPTAGTPVVTTTDLGNGETEVTICGNWPGIAYGDHDVKIKFTAELVVVRDGQQTALAEETLGSESVTVWYDSVTMREECQVPDLNVLILDPYCVNVEGEWGMAWAVANPSDLAINFGWTFPELGVTGSNTVPANEPEPGMLFYVSPLGTHTAEITWGDNQSASLEFTIDSCKETPPPGDPTPVPTPPVNPPEYIPVTGVEAVEPPPVVDAGLLIPVTGADTSASQNGGLFQKMLYNIGFAFLGIGLIFSGIQKKLGK